jgi:hypothetical protein
MSPVARSVAKRALRDAAGSREVSVAKHPIDHYQRPPESLS